VESDDLGEREGRDPGVGGALRAATVKRSFALVALATAILAGCGGGTAASDPDARLPRPSPLLRQLIGFKVRYRELLRDHRELVRVVRVPYRANGGRERIAYLVLPRWYGPRTDPRIPLVISPHGRGVTPRDNIRFWGGLPAFGPFAVVSPEGQGRRLTLYSWGWRGQIDDLARMPQTLERTLPWLHIDHKRIYAVGSSMGGQETLLLVAFHPRLLAGASALDSATDMAARYREFSVLKDGSHLQELARVEIGGTPESSLAAYMSRSPIHYVRQLAFSGVPLHIWWSTRDRIVVDQNQESGRLFRAIKSANPHAPVTKYVGTWAHSHEMHALSRLPLALVRLRLIELDEPLPTSAQP
jgi:pimeloyl-ACP methyl ester carboxylesterase